jgi:hypothetical protein
VALDVVAVRAVLCNLGFPPGALFVVACFRVALAVLQ